jgi:multidrug efflux pump subunit AcrB
VPIVSLTLWTQDPQRGADDLARVAHTLETELKRVSGTRDLYTIGAPGSGGAGACSIRPGWPVTVLALADCAARCKPPTPPADAGALVGDNREIPVQAGSFLVDPADVGSLVVGLHQRRAGVSGRCRRDQAGSGSARSVTSGWVPGPAAATKGIAVRGEFPAVTLAIAKKPGENAVVIAEQMLERVEQLKGTFIPEGVNITVTRNYGVTANDKAMT